jgi:PqqA peptide cyclase
MVHKPLGLLAELTHRCPLGCPYCSNPLAFDARKDELDTATWVRVFSEAAGLGVLQVHLSGGEPGARRDLVDITAGAVCTENLIRIDYVTESPTPQRR